MLYTIVASRFGTNAPIWRLVNEWWYYSLFGFAMVVAHGRTIWSRIPAAAALVAILWLLPIGTTLIGLIWVIGLLAFLSIPRLRWVPPIWVAMVLFVAILAVGRALRTNGDFEGGGGLALALRRSDRGSRVYGAARQHCVSPGWPGADGCRASSPGGFQLFPLSRALPDHHLGRRWRASLHRFYAARAVGVGALVGVLRGDARRGRSRVWHVSRL